ncbi:cytochrome c [uncultured Roseobacter sp.]|uniref:cytochrome c n=1 Tax=uncultured Roseobacter sp. TaxID=114847 RepID=UPI00260F459B|nr:cytochrome c [uncultured Roseobacter sp.]
MKIAVLADVVAGLVWMQCSPKAITVSEPKYSAETAAVTVSVPATLSGNAQVGKVTFDANCHSSNTVNQLEIAPSPIHAIHQPSHHGDEVSQSASAVGMRGRQRPIRSMPPVEGCKRSDVQMILAYVRDLQGANGIS